MNTDTLDKGQYTETSIDHYEAIFGRDFVSPGGVDMARELIRRMNLPSGSRVLDVGCGLGGAAFLMAGEFKHWVDGIDLSANMIKRAQVRLDELGADHPVSLTLGDCLELDVDQQYDAIYSRDVFLHIHDKDRLFQVLHRALKSGGTLLFTDYCCGDKPWQPAFADYVDDRGYCLHTVPDYVDILRTTGFIDVEGLDWTNRFVQCLRGEVDRIGSAGLDRETADALKRSWHEKIERALGGDHRWGLFRAARPLSQSVHSGSQG